MERIALAERLCSIYGIHVLRKSGLIHVPHLLVRIHDCVELARVYSFEMPALEHVIFPDLPKLTKKLIWW